MKTIKCQICGEKDEDRDGEDFECDVMNILGVEQICERCLKISIKRFRQLVKELKQKLKNQEEK